MQMEWIPFTKLLGCSWTNVTATTWDSTYGLISSNTLEEIEEYLELGSLGLSFLLLSAYHLLGEHFLQILEENMAKKC